MYKVGRVCVKIAGRDGGKKCVIVEDLKDGYVMIDGQTRRKKCNVRHLEPLNKVLKIKAKVSSEEVAKLFKSEFDIEIKKATAKKADKRPVKQRQAKDKPKKEKKAPAKKTESKPVAKEEKKTSEKPATKKTVKKAAKTAKE
jgi:large subunit ribosomal protein L14e